MMKRSREVSEILGMTDGGSIDLARCLIMLSHGPTMTTKAMESEGSYECKTCNRKFPSFQALGGHRANHKKPRLVADSLASAATEDGKNKFLSLSLGMKPKMHECSICGLKFPMGQALGGHMRRHRIETMRRVKPYSFAAPPPVAIPVLKRSNSSKRVVGCMDLNLTPLENDLKLLFGEKAPKVDGFL
ncbi:hypothetical protein SAY86_005611 [Trapa natans]|uniref:C2H2-type domain-containing protein n=1 Tax=Trapa natans TaxID=22666 RepID=A0AAN7KV63_TRANT|nr:hypothetical protein SAY86_005611 [Trapa natans]